MPRKEHETIEIGAVLVDKATLKAAKEFDTFVKPVKHPELTDFCTQLTSISQADVDSAPLFPQAIAALKDFIGDRDVRFCTWGYYDKKQLEQDAIFHKVKLPKMGKHCNIKALFAEKQEIKPFGMEEALDRVGVSLEGTHHRGIEDVRNMVRLLPWIFG